MTEYISREDAIEMLTQMQWHDEDGYPIEDYCDKRRFAEDWINQVHSADYAPVKYGKWVKSPGGESYRYPSGMYSCSVCGFVDPFSTGKMNYCPNCGADMRGG